MAETTPPETSRRGQPSRQNTGAAAGHDDLAHRLSDLARDLQVTPDTQGVLDRIVAAAVDVIPGVEHASISMVRRRRDVTSAAATSDVAVRFDATQQQVGQGPCLDSAYEHLTVRVADLSRETRWPALAQRASDIGVRSALCLQLYVQGDDLGAMNLTAAAPDVFDDESEHVGLFLASHAAVAVADTQKLNGLAAALANRDLIGQAKGILMARYKVTADAAFTMLSKLSQDTNRKLLDVADAVVTTGQLRD